MVGNSSSETSDGFVTFPNVNVICSEVSECRIDMFLTVDCSVFLGAYKFDRIDRYIE